MTTSNINWNIQHTSYNWASEEELLVRDEMIPAGARIEIHDGKLLFNDEDRLTLLAMLLENLGLDTAIAGIEALREAIRQESISEDDESRDSFVDDANHYDKEPAITTLPKSPHTNTKSKTDTTNSDRLMSPGQIFKKFMDDFSNNPIRYVIHYPPLENIRFYLNIESDMCSIDLNSATAFRDLSAARAVADVYDDSSLHIAQISINGDERTMLSDNF